MLILNTDNKKESIAARVLHSPIFVAASGIAVILLAVAFDNIKSSLSVQGILIATSAFLFIVLMNLAISGIINKIKNQDYFDARLETLNNIILNNNMHWLVNQKYVQMLEMQADEIWAFAPELTFAIEEGSDIFKAVQTTLARGAKYKIFMPNRPETHKIIADYRRLHVFKPGQVQFILLPHEEYVFHTIISLYNPHSSKPQAIEWLAVDNLVAWLEMDLKHANRMVGIGEVLLKHHQETRTQQDPLVKELPRAHTPKPVSAPKPAATAKSLAKTHTRSAIRGRGKTPPHKNS